MAFICSNKEQFRWVRRSLLVYASMKLRTLKCLVLLFTSLLLIIFCFRSDLKSQLSWKQISKPHSSRGKLAKVIQVKYHRSGKKTAERRDKKKKIPINSKIRNKKGALIHFRAIESIIMDLHTLTGKNCPVFFWKQGNMLKEPYCFMGCNLLR